MRKEIILDIILIASICILVFNQPPEAELISFNNQIQDKVMIVLDSIYGLFF